MRAQALTIGDRIFRRDRNGLASAAVTSIRAVDRACVVYNLRTDSPHTFFANGIAVHSK